MKPNPILRFARNHPVCWGSFCWAMGTVSALAGAVESWAWIPGLVFFALLAGLMTLARLAPLILAAAIVLPARSEEPQPLIGYVAGGAVLVGAGYATYRIARYCARRFPKAPPKPTNAKPTNAEPDQAAADVHGFAWSSWSQPSCFQPAEDSPPAVVALAIDTRTGRAVLTLAQDSSCDLAGWSDGLAALGLSSNPSWPGVSASLNYEPIPPETSAIWLDPEGRVSTAAGGVTVTVSRSLDLQTWEPMGAIMVETGTQVSVEDVTGAAVGFYRVELWRE